jgi:hypothetical protein
MENDVLTIEGEKKADFDEKTDRHGGRAHVRIVRPRDPLFPTSTDGTGVKARLVKACSR